MKLGPRIAGAVVLVAMAGGVAGAALGESPMLQSGVGTHLPQSTIITAGNDDLRNYERLPDHYPLVTPEGTVEVAELSLRGRLHDRGGNYVMYGDGPADGRAYAGTDYDFYETASPERIAQEQRILAYHQATSIPANQIPSNRVTRAEGPLALAEPVEVAAKTPEDSSITSAAKASIGNSKTVDVTAALALNN